MKLGIMGGTFNPPHKGHLEAARNVYEALQLDEVLFIPTNIPPHKSMPCGSATPAQRLEMVRKMLENEPWAQASSIELTRGGASYTVDTIRRLYANGDKLSLILGTDMLLSFSSWREPAEICRMATLAVVARHDNDRERLQEQISYLQTQYHADIRLVDCPALPISSTQVRNGILSTAALPAAVAQYIMEHKLYHTAHA